MPLSVPARAILQASAGFVEGPSGPGYRSVSGPGLGADAIRCSRTTGSRERVIRPV